MMILEGHGKRGIFKDILESDGFVDVKATRVVLESLRKPQIVQNASNDVGLE